MSQDFYILNVDGKKFNVSTIFLKEYEDTLLAKSLLTQYDLPGLIYHLNDQIFVTDIDNDLFKILISNMRKHTYHKINQYTDDETLDELYNIAKLFGINKITNIIENIKLQNQKHDEKEINNTEEINNLVGGENQKVPKRETLHQILNSGYDSNYETDISDYSSGYDSNNGIEHVSVQLTMNEEPQTLNYDNIDFYSLMTSADPQDQELFKSIMETNLQDPFNSPGFMLKFSTDPNVKKYLQNLTSQNDNPDIVSSDYSDSEIRITESSKVLADMLPEILSDKKFKHEESIIVLSDFASDDGEDINNNDVNDIIVPKSIDNIDNTSSKSNKSKSHKSKSNVSEVSYQSTSHYLRDSHGARVMNKINTKFIKI